MIMRTMNEILNDVAMMGAARDIRKYLTDLNPKMFKRLGSEPNPFYGHTLDGLVLFDSGYGLPDSIGTPFGEWEMSSGGTYDSDWLEIATPRLGLIQIVPETYDTNPLFGGMRGAAYAITKDLQGNPLPDVRFVQERHGVGRVCESHYSELTPDRTAPDSREYRTLLNLASLARSDEDFCNELPEIQEFEMCEAAWKRIEPKLGDWKFLDDEDEANDDTFALKP
jgi:hypothetical protein